MARSTSVPLRGSVAVCALVAVIACAAAPTVSAISVSGLMRAAQRDDAAATQPDSAAPTESPIELYFTRFIDGDCDAMYGMLAEGFSLWIVGLGAGTPPLQLNATQLKGACEGQPGANWHSAPFDAYTLGDWSTAAYGSIEIKPSLVGGDANCTVPQNSRATATTNAAGLITTIHMTIQPLRWGAGYNRCKGTPIPPPDATPGAMPIGEFVDQWLWLNWGGQCSDMAKFFASNFSVSDPVGSTPMDGNAFMLLCKSNYASAANWLQTNEAAVVSYPATGTAELAGIMSTFVRDPQTLKPCGIFCELASVRVRCVRARVVRVVCVCAV